MNIGVSYGTPLVHAREVERMQRLHKEKVRFGRKLGSVKRMYRTEMSAIPDE